MTSLEPTDSIIAQGRILVWAIEALDAIESSEPFERAVAELFRAAYKRRLIEIIEAVPPWMAQEILNAPGPTEPASANGPMGEPVHRPVEAMTV